MTAPHPVEVAEAALVETVARAIAAGWAGRFPNDNEPWEHLSDEAQDCYRAEARDAAAAIAVYRAAQDASAPPSPAGITARQALDGFVDPEIVTAVESGPRVTERLREEMRAAQAGDER